MKKIVIFISLLSIVINIPNLTSASDLQMTNGKEASLTEDDIISSQKASLNIGGLIREAKKYTEDVLEKAIVQKQEKFIITSIVKRQWLSQSSPFYRTYKKPKLKSVPMEQYKEEPDEE